MKHQKCKKQISRHNFSFIPFYKGWQPPQRFVTPQVIYNRYDIPSSCIAG